VSARLGVARIVVLLSAAAVDKLHTCKENIMKPVPLFSFVHINCSR
jgi:hypothetical protein